MTYKLLVFNKSFADEINVPALAVMTEEEFQDWSNRKLDVEDTGEEGVQYLYDYLGNFGYGFKEQFENYTSTTELLNKGIVRVYNVTEEFVNTFKEANLDSLSLCSIFNIK